MIVQIIIIAVLLIAFLINLKLKKENEDLEEMLEDQIMLNCKIIKECETLKTKYSLLKESYKKHHDNIRG